MRITPRYEGPPVLRIDLRAGDPSVPLLRQRRRLADILGRLHDEEWAAPSRCDQWSVQDVVAHLSDTNQFWALSIAAGLAGEPTRMLASFDPVATPAQMVEGARTMTPSEVLARYVETVEALAQVVTDLDDEEWSQAAEAPPGHIAAHAVALHALWDGWVHERDIVVPLGYASTVEADEVASCLRYAAALGPAFLASSGSARRGRLVVDATEPDVLFMVEAGPTVVVSELPPLTDGPRLAGDAVSLVEALSFRAPFAQCLAEPDQWLLGGLDQVFDVAPAEAT